MSCSADSPDEDGAPLHIAVGDLSADTLQAVIESFVLREGTDYGHEDRSLVEKVAQVRRQIESGDAQIMFDPVTESVTIVTAGK
ncbi:MAG: hypothetical protein ACI8PT_002302 [Gammaproteobacteria bacterium]